LDDPVLGSWWSLHLGFDSNFLYFLRSPCWWMMDFTPIFQIFLGEFGKMNAHGPHGYGCTLVHLYPGNKPPKLVGFHGC
jgi:hypothetical protein